MKKILLQLTLFLILSLFIPKESLAKTLEFQIFPAIIEIESEPGERIEHHIVIRGSGGESYKLEKYALNILDEYGRFTSSYGDEESLAWISFEPEEFSFVGLQEKRIKLIVDIPSEVSLGDYYLTIALERIDKEDTGRELEDMISGALEIPLLITVVKDGLPQIEGKTKSFELRKIYLSNPLTFRFVVENKGLRKLKSFGKLEITNLITKHEHIVELVPQNILSNSSRVVIDEYGFFTGRDNISWNSPSLFGIYSVNAQIYDRYFIDEDAKLILSTPNSYFVYFNIYLLVGVTTVLFALLSFLLLKRKKVLTKSRK